MRVQLPGYKKMAFLMAYFFVNMKFFIRSGMGKRLVSIPNLQNFKKMHTGKTQSTKHQKYVYQSTYFSYRITIAQWFWTRCKYIIYFLLLLFLFFGNLSCSIHLRFTRKRQHIFHIRESFHLCIKYERENGIVAMKEKSRESETIAFFERTYRRIQ